MPLPPPRFRLSLDTVEDVRAWTVPAGEVEGGVGPSADYTMMEWALLAPEPKVGRLDFASFPYQVELYSDEVADAREVVLMKSTQVGASSYLWRWAARRADQFGDTGIYIFPTDGAMTKWVAQRVEPSIDESPYLLSRIGEGFVKNKHQMRLGAGWLNFAGATRTRTDRRQAGAQSTDAEVVVFDEYDDLEPAAIAQFERRLSGAVQAGRTPRTRRVGIPSIDGWGIAAAFERSDQRVWTVTCPECGLDQDVRWEENVRWVTSASGDRVCRPGHDQFRDEKDVVRAWRACSACEAELNVAQGRWVARRPGASVIGYHVTRLIVPRTDLPQIIENSRKTSASDVEAFWNNDLGLPYVTDVGGLSREVVEAAVSMGVRTVGGYRGPSFVTMGLDVASERELTCRVSRIDDEGRAVPLFVGEIDWDQASAIMGEYQVRMAVIDGLPERQQARNLAALYPGRVVIAAYSDQIQGEAFSYDERKNMVTIHRSDAISSMQDQVRFGVRLLPSNPAPRYVDQLVSLKRRRGTDNRGRPFYHYVTTGTAGDDFSHAEVYDVAAKEMLRMVLIQEELESEAGERLLSGGVSDVRLVEPSDEYYAGWGE